MERVKKRGNFGSVWFCFSKLFSVIKNWENKEKRENTWLPVFFFVLKSTENTKFSSQEQFSKTRTEQIFVSDSDFSMCRCHYSLSLSLSLPHPLNN